MPSILRSGDVLKLSPGEENSNGFKSLHLIHPDLKKFYNWGLIALTWEDQEDTIMGGDRRLSPVGLAKASWKILQIRERALEAVLDWIDFEALDCYVTARTWATSPRSRSFKDVSGKMRYLATASETANDNPWELFDVLFDFYDLTVLS